MEWLVVLLLLAMMVETAREAYEPNPKWLRDWSSRHYSRIQITKELPWWAERKSWRERRAHQQKHHIDLLARTRQKNLRRTEK